MSEREANQQRVDAAAQRVRQRLYRYSEDDTFRKDVELLIEIALAPVLEIFAAATPMAVDPSAGDRSMATAASDLDRLSAAYDDFEDYFVRNYPGPRTIIHKPKWHAPKIFQAVISALKLNDAIAMNESAPQQLQRESKTGAVKGAGERPVTPNSASRIGSTERGPGIPESGETGAVTETK